MFLRASLVPVQGAHTSQALNMKTRPVALMVASMVALMAATHHGDVPSRLLVLMMVRVVVVVVVVVLVDQVVGITMMGSHK